jgi:hypothetical protein
VADLGSTGKHHRRADVRVVRDFLFAIVSRLVDRETKLSREPAKPDRAYIDGETIPTG